MSTGAGAGPDGRTNMMMWSPRALSFGMFAILASALLVTTSTAQQDAAKRQQMVDEIDAMLARDAITGRLRVSTPCYPPD